MKKNLIVIVAFILIFTHIIPPYSISFANDEMNECESMDFTVQIMKENDEKIIGTAEVPQEIEIEFKTKGKTEILHVDSSSKFELKVDEEFLVLNDDITISNKYFKIDAKVAPEGNSSSSLQSEQYVECPVIEKTSEELTEEESSTAEISEELAEEESSTAEISEELAEEESSTAETSEELAEEEPSTVETSEELTEEEPSTVETSEELTEEEPSTVETSEELTEEELSTAETSEAETEEQPEASTGEETSADTAPEEETERSIAETFSVLSPNQIEGTYQGIAAPIDEIRGSSVTVSTGQEFTNALINNDVEYIRLSNNIKTSGTLAVRTRYGQKIIDANGYSINFESGQMELSSSGTLNREVRKFVILNATNLFSSNAGKNGGLIKKTTDEVSIYFENVNFNANNNTSGGILGSSWEGNINFYGNNLINTYNGDYSMVFRKVFVHQNANLEINNYNGSSVFQFERNTRSYGDDEYGLQVETNGTLNANSNAAVITSNLSRALLSDRILTNRFGINSNVVLSGTGSSIFPIDTTANNFITNPEKLDLINNQSNGVLFNNSEDINFYLSETTLKGWDRNNASNQPSNISQPISTGQFKFSENNTTNVSLTPQQSNFSIMFPPQLRRMAFEESIPPIDILEIEEITDITTEITGITSPNVSIRMFDENGKILQTVESNSNGDFVFELEKPFEAGTLLQFQAQSGHVKSDIVEQTVIGNRLELIGVPDTIPFKNTEIQDEKIIIERENPNMTVSVLDTRNNSYWHLTARALSPLTDSKGNNRLEESLYYIEGNNEQLIEDQAVEVGAKDLSSDSNVQKLSWGANEGILLKLNPIQAQAGTEYSTTIEWTLTDGP